MTDLIEQVARAIARGCNLDPDANSPKAAESGHSIPEWMFFQPAATAAVEVMSDRIAQLEAENARLIADRSQWVEPERMVLGKQHD